MGEGGCLWNFATYICWLSKMLRPIFYQFCFQKNDDLLGPIVNWISRIHRAVLNQSETGVGVNYF